MAGCDPGGWSFAGGEAAAWPAGVVAWEAVQTPPSVLPRGEAWPCPQSFAIQPGRQWRAFPPRPAAGDGAPLWVPVEDPLSVTQNLLIEHLLWTGPGARPPVLSLLDVLHLVMGCG